MTKELLERLKDSYGLDYKVALVTNMLDSLNIEIKNRYGNLTYQSLHIETDKGDYNIYINTDAVRMRRKYRTETFHITPYDVVNTKDDDYVEKLRDYLTST